MLVGGHGLDDGGDGIVEKDAANVAVGDVGGVEAGERRTGAGAKVVGEVEWGGACEG